jgi:hypothetical protein
MITKDRCFDIAVTTEIWQNDIIWWSGGTMCWFNVDQEVCDWLAGSCKTTAFWLLGLPEAVGGKSYSIRYRTLVTADGAVVSYTTMVQFDGLIYEDVIRFQRWALNELSEMISLFESKHSGMRTKVSSRRWVRQLWRLVTARIS